jgi:CubicO group peptidase (beta-lactamase class C family)
MGRRTALGASQARRRAAAAVLAAGFLLAIAATGATADATAVRTTESARIDRWVEDRMAAHAIPGSAVAVVRGGHVTHLAGYGTADGTGREVTPQTAFLIGSVSKPFTAVVLAQLVDEGLLSWDEPVWPHLEHLTDDPPTGFEQATVQQLLDHTGGLGMSAGVAGDVKIHDGPDALDRRAAELLAVPLRFAPGERWEYSNAGPTLLAAAVERITGDNLADQLRDRVFDPLGMHGSFATEQDPRAAALATGHQLWFGRWRPAALPYDSAGVAMGYIGSTAQDLAAFMQAHLHGHQAIPATAQQIADGPVTPTRVAHPAGRRLRARVVRRRAGRTPGREPHRFIGPLHRPRGARARRGPSGDRGAVERQRRRRRRPRRPVRPRSRIHQHAPR